MSDNKYMLSEILAKNRDKVFVDRIINRKKYPVLKNKDGTVSTHSMAWSESNGKYYVYPTVLYTEGKLQRFDDDTAWRHSISTGNYIEFNTPEEAEWFSKNYKRIWDE